MKTIQVCIATIFLFIISGCAVNGKHIYTEDGQCISCWNNPLTGKPVNHDGTASLNRSSKNASTYLNVDNTNIRINKKPLYSSDDLLVLYHSVSESPLPQTESIVRELSNGKGELSVLAKNYRKERNAFNKKDIEKVIHEKVNDNISNTSKERMIFQRIYLSEYDFESESYFVCFNKDCSNDSENPKEKFGAVKYGLIFRNLNNKNLLRVSTDKASKLEQLAAKGTGFNYRAIPVLINVSAKATIQDKKWSDGEPYRELLVDASNIELLNDWPNRNLNNLSSISVAEALIVKND